MESTEEYLLKQCTKHYPKRPIVKRQIISGKKKYKWISKEHIIIDGSCEDKRLHIMMDDLYDIYRLDPTTVTGTAMMPLIDTLRYHKKSEFHIYLDNNVIASFMIYFLLEFSDVKMPVHTISFVWVVPKFRGNGLFAKMYHDLEINKNMPIYVDQPNDACQKALQKFEYSASNMFDFYNK